MGASCGSTLTGAFAFRGRHIHQNRLCPSIAPDIERSGGTPTRAARTCSLSARFLGDAALCEGGLPPFPKALSCLLAGCRLSLLLLSSFVRPYSTDARAPFKYGASGLSLQTYPPPPQVYRLPHCSPPPPIRLSSPSPTMNHSSPKYVLVTSTSVVLTDPYPFAATLPAAPPSSAPGRSTLTSWASRPRTISSRNSACSLPYACLLLV